MLVDDDNTELGTARKKDIHTDKTPLHRAFSIYIFNSQGELLTQQRASTKITWPLIWSNSCCGHPGPGEKTEDAVKRRVKEELGLDLDKIWNVLPDFRYREELNGIVENELCPVFVAFTDQEPEVNRLEVENIKWVPWKQFLKKEINEISNFSPWGVTQARELSQSSMFNELLEKHTS